MLCGSRDACCSADRNREGERDDSALGSAGSWWWREGARRERRPGHGPDQDVCRRRRGGEGPEGCQPRCGGRLLHRVHRPVGKRQDDAAHPAGVPRQAEQRAPGGRRDRRHAPRPPASRRLPRRADRLRLPELQSDSRTDGARERRIPAGDGAGPAPERTARQGARAPRGRRHGRPAGQAPRAALGRPEAARGHRARARHAPRAGAGGRAHCEPRQGDRLHDHRAHEEDARRGRHDLPLRDARHADHRRGRDRLHPRGRAADGPPGAAGLMGNVVKIAVRNLLRYTRRSLLTVSLIAFGVVFVLVFVAMAGSFKEAIVGSITDNYLGHLQIHRRGYVASIESLPLNLNIEPAKLAEIQQALREVPEVAGASERIKFNAMFSTFVETTGLRITAVYPEREFAVCPKLPARIVQGDRTPAGLARGKILVPELLARGMGIKVGDTVVVVATNKDGSVNGKTLLVSGILESATGPGGRDGYIHFEDGREILRMPGRETMEVAIRLRDFGQVERLGAALRERLEGRGGGREALEVHTWSQLSPFSSVARLIDMMALFMKLMLIAIVLISILNVMIMV